MEQRALIGRELPLQVLREALAAPPALFLLSGEAGIGKTRVVAEVEASGCFVLHGECIEFGGEALAYAPVLAALRDLPADWLTEHLTGLTSEARGTLAAVLLREVPGPGAPAQLYELVLELLGRLAEERGPVLLVLEDIH